MWGVQGGHSLLLVLFFLKRFFMARYEHLPIYKKAMDVVIKGTLLTIVTNYGKGIIFD